MIAAVTKAFDLRSQLAEAGAPVRQVRGRVIAQFTDPRDAEIFATLKREDGQDVVVMPSTSPQFVACVRLLVPAL